MSLFINYHKWIQQINNGYKKYNSRKINIRSYGKHQNKNKKLYKD